MQKKYFPQKTLDQYYSIIRDLQREYSVDFLDYWASDMFTTGDKLLNVMKEEEIGIAELSRISGVPERTILDIMAGVKEPELGVMCKIAEGLGICVHELRADEESYAVSVSKDTLAKLIVVSEINNVELEELINCILEKGIEEHGFYL